MAVLSRASLRVRLRDAINAAATAASPGDSLHGMRESPYLAELLGMESDAENDGRFTVDMGRATPLPRQRQNRTEGIRLLVPVRVSFLSRLRTDNMHADADRAHTREDDVLKVLWGVSRESLQMTLDGINGEILPGEGLVLFRSDIDLTCTIHSSLS